jgi:hypothetical protein
LYAKCTSYIATELPNLKGKTRPKQFWFPPVISSDLDLNIMASKIVL